MSTVRAGGSKWTSQDRSLSKIQSSLLVGSFCSTVAGSLAMGADIIASAVPIPGFPLVLVALKGIYAIAKSCTVSDEESARLMAYCGATTASLSQYARVIKPTDAALRHLNEAATALEALKDLVSANAARSAFAQLFTGNEYKLAAMLAEKKVEAAVRSAMDLAMQQNMADVASINGKVDVLLKRRSPNPPPTFSKKPN
jgi:hypothetical protein